MDPAANCFSESNIGGSFGTVVPKTQIYVKAEGESSAQASASPIPILQGKQVLEFNTQY